MTLRAYLKEKEEKRVSVCLYVHLYNVLSGLLASRNRETAS